MSETPITGIIILYRLYWIRRWAWYESDKGNKSEKKENTTVNKDEGKSKGNDKSDKSSNDSEEKSNDKSTDKADNESSDDSKDEETSSDEKDDKQEEISQLIGKLYVLKSGFSSELAGIEQWVEDEYAIYYKEYGDGVPSSIKTKIGKAAYAKALALEEKCDGEINNILSRLEVLLEETGQDTSLVTEIRNAYENEKMVAKSKYMSKI